MLPTESQEAQVLVQWLQMQSLKFTHVPNETGHTMEARRRAVRMKREGTSAGFPDYTILIDPAQAADHKGWVIMIELKRRKGGTVSPAQRAWVDSFNALKIPGVVAVVARGAQEATDQLTPLLANRIAQVF